MYKKHGYYRNVSKKPDILDMVADIIIATVVLSKDIILKFLDFFWNQLIQSKKKVSNARKSEADVFQSAPSTADVVTKPITQTATVDNKYFLKQSLLTDTEKDFLKVLEEIVGDKYRIESQVPLSGVLGVSDSDGRYTNYHDFNKIKARVIDFILYDQDFKPFVAIELDDPSHLRWDRVKNDLFLNEVLQDAGLRILRIPTSYEYDLEDLRSQIFN